MGHMNVQHYVAMFDQASWAFFESFGLSARRMELEGLGMAALVQHNEYQQELFAGTVVEITTAVLEITAKTVRFRHVMRRRADGAVAATSELVAALIDRRERRARPWPDDLRQALERRRQSTGAD
ncbi:MAG: acyl-CoA thioesterase [Actinomycetia bacterium]|nr:acyl-CoA thioesterase [Actinomycetes bacterium]